MYDTVPYLQIQNTLLRATVQYLDSRACLRLFHKAPACKSRPRPPRWYRRFLSSLADPLLARLGRSAPNHKASRGLDYGCGPGPALAAMLREAGHEVAVYDPIFAPDRAAVAAGTQYDFVTCTEVAEHFYRPAEEFDTMAALVRGGGLLAVLTSFQPESADQFAEWHYRRDPTHVVFYGAGTLALLAEERGWTCEIPVKDVAIMRKPVDSS